MKKAIITAAIIGAFGSGIAVGFNGCKEIILTMVRDKEYVKKKLIPIIVQDLGQEKADKIFEIIAEK